GAVRADIHLQPFELNPQMAAAGEDAGEHIMRKYGIDEARMDANRAAIRERAAALKKALLRAYFSDGENVSDPDVLVRIAGDTGLDAGEARRVLDSGEYADEVRAQERRFQQAGIHSVPATIVNGTHLISGGQPPEVFERALREIAEQATGAGGVREAR